MFEQGTPGPSANSNMIERLTNLSSKGAEPQRPIEGLRRHLRIDPKRSDLVLHAAMRDVRFGSKCEILIWSRCFPLYTGKRTQVRHHAMTVSCQLRTHAPQ
jgi:ribosomal protein L31